MLPCCSTGMYHTPTHPMHGMPLLPHALLNLLPHCRPAHHVLICTTQHSILSV